MTKLPEVPMPALPEGIVKADLTYPKWKANATAAEREGDSIAHTLTLYYTPRLGWLLATLHIRNGSSRQQSRGHAARTYAVSIADGKVYTVGLGPHVTHTATVYVRRSRAKALAKFVDLHQQGLGTAGEIRDRISSRRAQTIARRGGGFGWL